MNPVLSCLPLLIAAGPLPMAPGAFPLPPLSVREGLPPAYQLTYVVHAYANWSPDDRLLVFQSNASGNWDLYVIGVEGEGLRPLVTDAGNDITPVFSPDGRRIVFVSERDGNREVYVCAADGTRQERLTRDPGHDIHPVWSPDGQRLLFSSNRGNGDPNDYDLYTMTAEGADVRQLTHGPAVDTYASWSPDGKQIVTRRVVDGNNEVFVMRADGSQPRNLTNDPAYDGWPVWSSDGRQIAFASGPGGRSPHRVYLMAPDGTGRTLLTDAPPGTAFVYDTQPAFSHDGTRLVFTRYHIGAKESADLCVLRLPKHA